MGFLENCGAIEISEARATHKYMFTQHNNRLYCVLVGTRGTGEIWESRNQGLAWQQVDDVGQCDAISIRGGHYVFSHRRAGYAKVVIGSVTTGNIVFEGGLVNGTWTGGLALPVPELGPTIVMAVVRETFGSQWYFHDTQRGTAFGRVPGDRMFAMWGTEQGGFPHGRINVVWEYVDRFWEAIRYACWGTWMVDRWIIEYYPQNPRGGPYAHRFENDIHGSGYEGFMNARAGWEGVGKQEGNPSPSFFMPADHWQGNLNNSAPMWIPNLTSTSHNLKFPINSTPNGLTGDSGASRGAVMGWVGGRRTFGMIEPGFGFAHGVGEGYYRVAEESNTAEFSSGSTTSFNPNDTTTKYKGIFANRKFIGNLGIPFTRSVMWMPYSSGIFGMGVGAFTDNFQTQKIMWIYDKEPTKIPTSVQVENGVYTDRDDKQASQARRGDSAYYRW